MRLLSLYQSFTSGKQYVSFFGITQEDALVMFSYDNYDQAKIDKDTMIRFIERIIQKYK